MKKICLSGKLWYFQTVSKYFCSSFIQHLWSQFLKLHKNFASVYYYLSENEPTKSVMAGRDRACRTGSSGVLSKLSNLSVFCSERQAFKINSFGDSVLLEILYTAVVKGSQQLLRLASLAISKEIARMKALNIWLSLINFNYMVPCISWMITI